MANFGAIYSTEGISTPSLIAGNGSTGVQVLASNPARIGFSVQNVGTTTAWILIGGTATSSVYNYALKGGSGNNDGTGGSISFFSGAVPTGIITLYGASSAIVTTCEITI